ncbi:MAG: T9SS type A sorting domain-containing protein [Bacteroidia bacterium]
MKRIILTAITLVYSAINCQAQVYPDNESYPNQDMLTPQYYNTPSGGMFRTDLNKLVHFAHQIPFRHPLKDSLGQLPAISTPTNGDWGAGKGPGGTAEHHPAIDLHVGTNQTLVNMYAAHDGTVNTFKNSTKYRHYLTIKNDIKDSLGNILGKIVTIYAHLDLDLDSAAGLQMNGVVVNKGDLVAKNLYSGTMGGPHMHLEIRYYRNADLGDEEYYGWSGISPLYTDPSAGIWTYGKWNPNIAFGFAYPDHHLSYVSTGIVENNLQSEVLVYPNPTSDIVTIDLKRVYGEINFAIYNVEGKLIRQNIYKTISKISLNTLDLNQGIYFVHIGEKESNNKMVVKLIKE